MREGDNKREHNLSSLEIDEENVAMDFPFEKKLPIWMTLESMEVFKRFSFHPIVGK